MLQHVPIEQPTAVSGMCLHMLATTIVVATNGGLP